MPPLFPSRRYPRLGALVLFAVLLGTAHAAHAQRGAVPPAGQSAPPNNNGIPSLDRDDPNDIFHRDTPELRERLQRGRAQDRQRRMVDDAKRLVDLTSQYRKSLEAHGTATQEDQKLLLEIEKLARDVKDRMRGM